MAHGVTLAVSGSRSAAAFVARARMPWPKPPRAVVVDTRQRALCERRSVAGGLCLSPRVFQDRCGRLPSFRNVRWLLGTMGLTGSETAVVAGDDGTARDFVAGLLYLAGQRRVEVIRGSLTGWLDRHPRAAGTGRTRGVFREAIYVAWPRTRLVVLHRELAAFLRHGPRAGLVDGGSGDRRRGPRAYDPIPGARSSLLAGLGQVLVAGSLPAGRRRLIVYGEGSYETLAYFARLRMLGVPARVVMNGRRDRSEHARAARVRGRSKFAAPPLFGWALAAAWLGVVVTTLVWRRTRRR